MAECPGFLSPALERAAALFNAGAWIDCHEVLERLWLAETGRIRGVYQGILQIGVACHHLSEGNVRGARRLIDSGCGLLAPFLPSCLGLDLADLTSQAQALAVALRDLPDRGLPGSGLPPAPKLRPADRAAAMD